MLLETTMTRLSDDSLTSQVSICLKFAQAHSKSKFDYNEARNERKRNRSKEAPTLISSKYLSLKSGRDATAGVEQQRLP